MSATRAKPLANKTSSPSEFFRHPCALVDTGAESSWVPSAILESLGIERRKTMRFRQANGQILERWLGPASFYVAGKHDPP